LMILMKVPMREKSISKNNPGHPTAGRGGEVMNIKIALTSNPTQYYCPACGEVFNAYHLYGAVDIQPSCSCFVAFQEGFIKIPESKINFPKMIKKQTNTMAYLIDAIGVKLHNLMETE
jgi:hypothetical protein